MPVTCFFSIGVGGIIPDCARPMLDMLDKIADAAARVYFGSDMRAAHRWGKALGFD
jgi:hypothetical protein